MKNIILKVELRQILGNKTRALRRAGVIPAVLYGKGIASQNIAVNARDFERAYKQAGESTLVDLKVGDAASVKALIQDVAKHHLTLKPIHADFYQVSMTEKLTASVPLKFTGEAPAIKELGGMLVKNLQEIKVECLPRDLAHEIEVNISCLKTFSDVITVGNITLPSGMRALNKPDDVVALAQAPRQEEEAVAVASVDEKSKIEGIKVVAEEKKAEKEKEKDKAP